MNFCPKCGNKLNGGGNRCPSCGEDLSQFNEKEQNNKNLNSSNNNHPDCNINDIFEEQNYNNQNGYNNQYGGNGYNNSMNDYGYYPNNEYNYRRRKTNGMAIAGFVCSFFIPLFGWVFGGIGLKNSKECGTGKGLSVAAIIISTLSFIINLALLFSI